MATSATTCTFQAPIRGDSGGPADVLVQWVVSSPTALRQFSSLAPGFHTSVAVPVTTSVAVLIPPTTNTQAITLKGANGDTGVPLSTNTPTILSIPLGAAGFVFLLGSGSVVTLEIVTI